MQRDSGIPLPQGGDDKEAAKRVFDEFYIFYQPVLSEVDSYLETLMNNMETAYAQAYQPWHAALQDLMQGVYLTVKKIPLPDRESFLDAIALFSFESAAQFLYDLCLSCRINLSRDWIAHFQKHINQLLFAAATLFNRQQQSPVR